MNDQIVLVHILPQNSPFVMETFSSTHEGWTSKLGLNYQRLSLHKVRKSNGFYNSFYFCRSSFHYMSKRRIKKFFASVNNGAKVIFIDRPVRQLNQPIHNMDQVLDCLYRDAEGGLWANFK